MATIPITSHRTLGREPSPSIKTNDLSLSFTLALKDGASGTTPLSHQQPALSLPRADIPYIATATFRVVSAFVASIINRQRRISWVDAWDISLYCLLSLLELQLLLSVPLLWLVVPGLALLPWLCLQGALIWTLLRYVNTGRALFIHAAGKATNDRSSSEEPRSEWFIIGGFTYMRRGPPPKLASTFGHDIHLFPPDRFGLVFDVIFIFFQRNFYIPTTRSIALYNRVKGSLLQPEIDSVRILAHHAGSLDVS
ncbi:uncharacterized protein F4822DRAFT_430794 [Hypoxylon trugodes]|uniref:uncharacterized protein n=1 Tax=Hypoxylon trugodes TaxID=326681 RepID=UPI00219CC955|nr:uncharacterized protein F4822DRAFT_430794 [Hypoxylon trugodes]KAI1388039.1 hypothetical protein F4822DRAFT_430794 [Hypoxylon trugodes]